MKKFAIVTGASKGLGRAFALELGSRGINTILVSLPGEDIHLLNDEIITTYNTSSVFFEVDTVNRISPQTLEAEWNKETYVLDVRKETEYAAEHIDEAYNKPLDCINSWFMEMDDSKPFYLHCAGGYRSMITASILKSRGVHNFKEVDGGFAAIAKTQLPKTDFMCQSKLQKLS